jgi:hypothetical protein
VSRLQITYKFIMAIIRVTFIRVIILKKNEIIIVLLSKVLIILF